MPTVAVSGFDTAAIHTARDLAGTGGTVVFPAGNYDVDGLTASLARQTWRSEGPVSLKRTAVAPAGAVITQTATGLRLIELLLDGNRGVNPNVGNGVYAPSNGMDLEIDNCTIQNIAWTGIDTRDCELIINRATIRGTKQDGVIWSNPSGVARRGPQIDRLWVDRQSEDAISVRGGCIKIHGNGHLDSRITNSRCIIQYTDVDEAVLIEVIGGANTHVLGCTLTGGHTAVSIGQGAAGHIVANNVMEYQRAYGIEDGGDRGLHEGNNILGVVGGTIVGIIGNGCTRAKAASNNIVNCTTRVQTVYSGALQDINNV